jgi:hypothetical protein
MPDRTDHSDPSNGAPESMRVASEKSVLSRRLNPGHVADWIKGELATDRLASFFKTLLWVGPLTLLIWIYAERQQQVKTPQVTIPVEVEGDQNMFVRITKPSDGNVVVTVKGPKGAVDRIPQLVNPLQGNQPVKIRLEKTGPGLQYIPTVRIGQDRRFVDAGITIESAQPESIEVLVEPYVEEDVPIRARNPDQSRSVTFEPATVHVRAPASMLREQKATPTGLTATVDIPAADGATDTETLLRDLKVSLSLDNKKYITFSPVTVTARLKPTGLVEYTLPAVLLRVAATEQVLKDYEIIAPLPLYTVTVVGPREEIERMKNPNAPAPRAFVELRPTVGAGENDADVHYEASFPPRVTVKDAPSTVKVTLIPRR